MNNFVQDDQPYHPFDLEENWDPDLMTSRNDPSLQV